MGNEGGKELCRVRKGEEREEKGKRRNKEKR